ncbi:aa5ff937-aba4-4b5b-a8cd-5d4dcf81ceb8 [Thermothielavioides terrestris]|uniref:Aa5ff937-aba4-4b5b-a8cd-5d4dcf81ceb8 n=1 Tax=Thermothielavioides terrestris TaxID=2587410 RepID=A0A446BRF7_9PEZI|nr:aa5ff937-aba4-4b5b-a8cd-5d4dcf81ceb8 [Thermothielavioides terrestris]
MFSSLAGSKAHKHGSGHGNRQNAPKHSKAPKTTKIPRGLDPGTVPASFLFAVNEFQVDFEPQPGEDHPLTDQWFNMVPPQRAEAYTGEYPGTVFRYRNGVVSPAPGYIWYRPAMGQEGCIVRVNQAGGFDGCPAVYRSQTVFACSALLPMIVTDGDASLGFTFLRRLCPCDTVFDESYSTWSHLHFGGGDNGEGISYVYSCASGDPWVAGRDASWIPSLVPSVYRNTSPSAVPSRGLSGYLPIILALMGFHGRPGRASDVFSAHGWHQHRWTLSNRASNYLPKSGESPRGLYVQVCTDNLVDGLADSVENNIPVEQCTEVLQYLECCTILVQG